MDGVGGVRKMAIFAEVQYYIYTNVGWMGRSEKVTRCTDVIKGWSLTQRHPLQSKLFSTCVANDGPYFSSMFPIIIFVNTKLHFKKIELDFQDSLFIFFGPTISVLQVC